MLRLFWLGCFFSFCTLSCTPIPGEHVDAKVFALNGREFMERPVIVSGTIIEPAVGFSFFTLRDLTGTVMVGTENFPGRFPCKENYQVTLQGKLRTRNFSSGPLVYFSATDVLECK